MLIFIWNSYCFFMNHIFYTLFHFPFAILIAFRNYLGWIAGKERSPVKKVDPQYVCVSYWGFAIFHVSYTMPENVPKYLVSQKMFQKYLPSITKRFTPSGVLRCAIDAKARHVNSISNDSVHIPHDRIDGSGHSLDKISEVSSLVMCTSI